MAGAKNCIMLKKPKTMVPSVVNVARAHHEAFRTGSSQLVELMGKERPQLVPGAGDEFLIAGFNAEFKVGRAKPSKL